MSSCQELANIGRDLAVRTNLKCCCDHSLGSHDGSGDGHDKREDQPTLRGSIVEGVRVRVWVFAYVCSLATICEQKTRIGITQPTELDRMTAESTNVGEKSFDSSKGKKYAAKAPPAMVFVAYQVFESIVRVECLQDRVVVPASSANEHR